jgi:hypothetical protein
MKEKFKGETSQREQAAREAVKEAWGGPSNGPCEGGDWEDQQNTLLCNRT